MPYTFRMSLTISINVIQDISEVGPEINPIWIILSKYAQRLISQLVLDPAKLLVLTITTGISG